MQSNIQKNYSVTQIQCNNHKIIGGKVILEGQIY